MSIKVNVSVDPKALEVLKALDLIEYVRAHAAEIEAEQILIGTPMMGQSGWANPYSLICSDILQELKRK